MVWKPMKRCAWLAMILSLAAGCESQRILSIFDDPTAPSSALPKRVENVVPVPTHALGDGKQTQAVISPIQQVAAVQASNTVQGTTSGASPKPGTATKSTGTATLPLGLNEAIDMGLARNPDLVALRETEGVGQALVDVARTYPFNPTVQTRILPYNKAQAGNNAAMYNYVLVWQQFELAHQRHFREQNAAAALSASRWNIQQAELQNVAVTEQLYFAALYQKGLRDLADLTIRLNKEVLDVMELRLKAGKAAAADVAMVRIDTASARQQARLAEVNYRNALLALSRQLNLEPQTGVNLDGDLAGFKWHALEGRELSQLMGKTSDFTATADRATLVSELAARRPDVLAARATYEAGQANLRLARASRVPNLWLGPFYSRDSEAIVSVGFQAQMDIPVVNSGRPLVRQREAELRQQMTAFQQLEAKARIETRAAIDRYEQARSLWEQTHAESDQQLPQELQKLEAEFKKGEIDILRIFQARNSLILYRRTQLDSLNELALAAGALTAAAGLPPAALVSPPQSKSAAAPQIGSVQPSSLAHNGVTSPQAKDTPAQPVELLPSPGLRHAAILAQPLANVP